ncbi:MAG: DUF1801 domain-containing protein [Gemmatimonadales bacterium]|jgi:hypothetical protein|nr:MAG: DUF1801 domain-containing protein [Gemmatimonadales bacterium]
MAEPKTKQHDGSVEAFLETVEDRKRVEDCRVVMEMMERVTGEEPAMWGPSIIGFGSYHYVYASGREGDWPLTGVSPRKQSLSLYVMAGFDRYEELMARLGKHRTGKSCLYVNRLEDVDLDVLEELVRLSVEHMRSRYG